MIKKYLNLIDCEEYDIKIINDEKIFYELLLNIKADCESNNIIKSIGHQLLKIKKYIKPLLDNEHFDISLTGGCVRDLLMNKKIKDLDLLIQTNMITNKIMEMMSEFEIKTDDGFPIFNLIGKLLEKNHLSLNKYPQSDLKESIDTNSNLQYSKVMDLIGIIKVKDVYDCDFLLSYVNCNKHQDNYDYEMCKCYINLNDFFYEDKEFDYNYIYENTFVSRGFIQDVKNKTFTWNLNSLVAPEDVIHSLERHTLKLMNKYPDYFFQILLNEKTSKDDSCDDVLNFKILQNKLKMMQSLDKKDYTIKRVKL